MDRVLAPADKPDRAVVSRCVRITCVGVDDVGAGLGGAGVVIRGEAGKGFRLRTFIPVENGLSHFLVHALDVTPFFRKAPSGGIAVEVSQGLVNFSVGFEHTGAESDLGGRRFGRLNAAIDLAPGRSRDTGTNSGAMTGRQVAFLPNHVLEDEIFLGQKFHDLSD